MNQDSFNTIVTGIPSPPNIREWTESPPHTFQDVPPLPLFEEGQPTASSTAMPEQKKRGRPQKQGSGLADTAGSVVKTIGDVASIAVPFAPLLLAAGKHRDEKRRSISQQRKLYYHRMMCYTIILQ